MIKSTKGLSRNKQLSSLLAIALALCVACNGGSKNHEGILTKEQMVQVLTEIYLTEQKVYRIGLERDSAEHEFARFKQLAFEKKGITDSVFKKSFDYYMDRPKEMEIIYTVLVDSLSLMEQRIASPSKK